jgi:SAM-dependent methyltransferase
MTPPDAMPVDPANSEQLRAWDGDEGSYWAAHADAFDRSGLPFHRRLIDAASIGARDRVLDVGCGTGQTSLLAARAAPEGSVLGVDLSSPMLEYARRRATDAAVTNVAFVHADAQIHPFDADAFDVAISNAGATFFGDLVAGFENLARALRPGGRLVVQSWQSLPDNEWLREFRGAFAAGRDLPVPPPDAQSPFALSDPDRVRTILTRAGYVDVDLDGSHQEMWFGDDANAAYDFVAGLLGWMLEDLDDGGKQRAVDDLRATLAAHETSNGVVYDSAVWLVRATVPE